MLVTSMGCRVVVSDVKGVGKQRLLRGLRHDEAISALAVSSCGLAASGQVGCRKVPGYAAPVVVWSLEENEEMLTLRGLTRGVNFLEFSDDGRFLGGGGEDGIFLIWDSYSGEVVFGKKFQQAVSVFAWVRQKADGRRTRYQIALAVRKSSEFLIGDLYFEASRQQWALSLSNVVMPSTSLFRDYKCISVFEKETLVVGSGEGDVVFLKVHETKGGVFRGSLPLCAGGALSSLVADDGVYVGGGDGVIRKVADFKVLKTSRKLQGAVTSLVFSSNEEDEILAGTDAGRIYRILVGDFEEAAMLVSVSHRAKPLCVKFAPTKADILCSASEDGAFIVWDLASDYALALLALPDCKNKKKRSPAATCAAWVRDTAVILGFEDASIEQIDVASGKRDWSLATTHRSPVRAVAALVKSPKVAYVVTAADDGSCRVWNLATRDLLMDFADHSKPIFRVCIDVNDSAKFHTASRDGALFSYDLLTEKRTSHLQQHKKHGGFTALSQRKDSEQELVTADAAGHIKCWDCDANDPVADFHLNQLSPSESNTCDAIAVSPSGHYLAVAQGQSLLLFNLEQHAVTTPPTLLATGHTHSATINDLHWSSDERRIASVADDNCLCLWNLL